MHKGLVLMTALADIYKFFHKIAIALSKLQPWSFYVKAK